MALVLLFLIPLLIVCYGSPLPMSVNPKIVGGRKALLGEIPYQVSLQQTIIEHSFCGGVILNEYYVLTCAHCLEGTDILDISIVVGTIDLRQPYARYFPKSMYVHEQYNPPNSWINDIALIKVKTPFVFSSRVSPVVLPQQDEIVKAGAIAIVSGYGRLQFNGGSTKELHITSIQIANQTYCKNIHKIRQQNIHDTQICANDPSTATGSCQGDSGGPLMVDNKLVGLVSWGFGCADTRIPTVYTRVPSYINWIAKYTVSVTLNN